MAKPSKTAAVVTQEPRNGVAPSEQRPRRTKALGSLQVIDMAAFARCSVDTVRRWSAGESVQPRMDEVLTKAAAKYGVSIARGPT